jgi:hypothetical protein
VFTAVIRGEDETAVRDVANYATSRGLRVHVRAGGVPNIHLGSAIASMKPPNWAPAGLVLDNMRDEGLTHLEHLARLSFEDLFLICLGDSWLVEKFLTLMAMHLVELDDADPAELLVQDVDGVGLTVRTYNTLGRDNLASTAKLTRLTASSLTDHVRLFGPDAAKEVRAYLRARGLALKGE